ncbi:MAG: hypothetical protein KGL39_23925 [Patescibacteria group bacterium]|nr:hypothetical protein [Patescibacteria group bacterium]
MAPPDNVVQPRAFTPVEIHEEQPDPAFVKAANAAAVSALALGLKALSQRAIAGSKALFALVSVASGFWLWNNIPDPSPTQIVSLSIYAVFIIAANVIVRRV